MEDLKFFSATVLPFFERLESISSQIDLIALQTSSFAEEKDQRDALLTTIHRTFPQAFFMWAKQDFLRGKKYKTKEEFNSENDYDNWLAEYKKSLEGVDKAEDYYDQIVSGCETCINMFSLVLNGQFSKKLFQPYYFKIISNDALLSFEKYKMTSKALDPVFHLKKLYRIEKTRAGVLACIDLICMKWNIPMRWSMQEEQYMDIAKGLMSELDKLIDEIWPGYSKSKAATAITEDPFDEQLKDLGTRAGFEKALNSDRRDAYHFALCQRCWKEYIPRVEFIGEQKKIGRKNKYCDKCKAIQEKEKTAERVRKHRSKNEQ